MFILPKFSYSFSLSHAFQMLAVCFLWNDMESGYSQMNVRKAFIIFKEEPSW